MQLHKTATQASDFHASSNTSPLLAALAIESSKLDPLHGLFLSSPSVELLIKGYLHYKTIFCRKVVLDV